MKRQDDGQERRQKLVQCRLTNANGEERIRFVELECFRLWEYLVTQKHGMQVASLSVRLWVPAEDFRRHESLYRHSGEILPINRVTIDRYDPHFDFVHSIHRYCLEEDTPTLVTHLQGHLPEEGPETGEWELSVMAGYGIEPYRDEVVEPVALGLS